MYSSYTGFQKLRVCAVGASYPPEFYSWITNPRLRSMFEKIAIETEEDYQGLIKALQKFGVEVVRTKAASSLNDFGTPFYSGQRIPGPVSMVPRDELCMIGDKLYIFNLGDRLIAKQTTGLMSEYDVKSRTHMLGQDYLHRNLSANTMLAMTKKITGSNDYALVQDMQRRAVEQFNCFDPIIKHVQAAGNQLVTQEQVAVLNRLYPNGVIRLGADLYFGVDDFMIDEHALAPLKDQFPDHRIKFIKSDGHLDGVICPAKPGLLLSIADVPDHVENFPGWDIVYLENESWNKVSDWKKLKEMNAGKWWIPGHEQDQDLIQLVETWMRDWVGYVEETVFDVNALVIDEKNILVCSYNKQAFDAFERHGMTPHIVPWRHRYFWDGGLHCVTLDLDRLGTKLDYFA